MLKPVVVTDRATVLKASVDVIDAGQLRLQYFRVTNLTFNDEENTYTIAGAEYYGTKYDAVDNNARLDTPPTSLIPTGLVNQPETSLFQAMTLYGRGSASPHYPHHGMRLWTKTESLRLMLWDKRCDV